MGEIKRSVGGQTLISRLLDESGAVTTAKDHYIADSVMYTDGGYHQGIPNWLFDDIAKACAIARGEGFKSGYDAGFAEGNCAGKGV